MISVSVVRSGFRPLTGMVQVVGAISLSVNGFRPLMGMVQIWNEWFRDQNLFSPPYGDGTLNISQNIVKWKS